MNVIGDNSYVDMALSTQDINEGKNWMLAMFILGSNVCIIEKAQYHQYHIFVGYGVMGTVLYGRKRKLTVLLE